MRITESQLRSVVKRLIREQSEFDVRQLSKIEDDIENQLGVMGIQPSGDTQTNHRNVIQAAQALGHNNLPPEFLMQMAENWTDLSYQMG